MEKISNYFSFFCFSKAPAMENSILQCNPDYVFDTRLGKSEEDVDDTCYLEKFSYNDMFLYRLSSQYGVFYSSLITTDFDIEEMQQDIRDKYVNMFNLSKLLSDYANKK